MPDSSLTSLSLTLFLFFSVAVLSVILNGTAGLLQTPLTPCTSSNCIHNILKDDLLSSSSVFSSIFCQTSILVFFSFSSSSHIFLLIDTLDLLHPQIVTF